MNSLKFHNRIRGSNFELRLLNFRVQNLELKIDNFIKSPNYFYTHELKRTILNWGTFWKFSRNLKFYSYALIIVDLWKEPTPSIVTDCLPSNILFESSIDANFVCWQRTFETWETLKLGTSHCEVHKLNTSKDSLALFSRQLGTASILPLVSYKW